MKKLIQTKWFTYGTYLLLVLAVLLVGFILLNNNKTLRNVMLSFFEVAENRSFDYRQSIRVLHKQPVPNKDIVILAIDDASFEYLWDKYGEWPIPRNVYADIINHLEKSKPQAIIFDLMFIKSMRASESSDKELIEAMNKYNNIYTGMNFDTQSAEIRKPVDLPERLKINININNNSKIDFSKKYEFTNCRAILPELINGNVHVGLTSVIRNSDGIIRNVAPIMMYKNDFYPYLSFLVSGNYLTQKDTNTYSIDKNGNLLVKDTKIPLTKNGDTILNWYGPSNTHTVYPLYKVINEINNGTNGLNFKDKIILIGTTAMSLHDTKSVPVQEGVYPGVEIHATFINNVIDNNFIHKTDFITNLIILIGVICLVGLIVMLSTSTLFAILSTVLFTIAYLFISYYTMEIYNIWMPVVLPMISIFLAFALSFLAKYILKSKDFDYQYKLATIDGLTELYNHRYFQDTLRKQIEVSKRYNQTFSLIIIDIDFFKKFNDTYGHQAGDAVLRQVAQTLKKNSRATDCVCRYGGEEMSIILPNTNAEDALFNANRICKAVAEKEFKLNANDTSKVTISLGVATFPQDAETPQELIEKADKSLYYAKEHGRNQVGKIE
ncbi:MAG: diguanylate cyclase [bacterium]|nr:diguanylate cyclase [bacterium]